ncbi:MAG: hypothetical protein ACI8Z1_003588, partial [Candidatus Azotimanducaceae bacterium]
MIEKTHVTQLTHQRFSDARSVKPMNFQSSFLCESFNRIFQSGFKANKCSTFLELIQQPPQRRRDQC